MYLEFFRFSQKPFDRAPDPDFFYHTPSTRKVHDRIVTVIRQKEPYVLLTGEPGTGKTALLKSLVADSGLMIHWIFIDLAMEFSPHDDYSGYLFDRIKKKTSGFDSMADFQAIIIDGANHKDNKVLKKLFKLQTLYKKKGIVFTIIFAGDPGVDTTPVDTDHGNFAAHPNYYNFYLEAFNYQETRAAIDYRLKSAGYLGPELFKSDALKLIYQLSGGIPGTVFHICELALFLAEYHSQPEVTPQIIRKASKYLLVDKDAHNGEELPPRPPLTDPSRAGTAQTGSGGQVFRWRGAIAGLLILLGAGTWFLLRPLPTHKPQGMGPTVTAQPPSKDLLAHTKQPVVSPETSFQVTSREISSLTTAQPNSQVVKPERDSSQLTVETRPEQAPPKLLLLDNIPPPAAKFSKRAVPEDYVSEPDKADGIVTRFLSLQPVVKETNIDVQPYSAISNPVLQEGDSENSIPTQLADEKELQAIQEVSTQANKKFALVSPQSQKPDSPSKIHLAAITPEPPRALPTTQSTRTTDHADKLLRGDDLVSAAGNKQLELVQQLLESGVEVNSSSDTGETALMRAAWVGHLDMITLLLKHDPPVNQQSPEGWTALFYGAVKGHEDVVAKLLAQGAKPDLADLDGRTPLMAATWNGHTEIARLLLDFNVDPNRTNRDGWSSLMFAALKGDTDLARILLLHGGDPSIKNNEGKTCTQLAAHRGHDQFVSVVSSQNVLR